MRVRIPPSALQIMKLVIGLVGEKGSGKQTFVNFLKKIASSKTPRNDGVGGLNIRQVRFSDILAQTLLIWDIPLSRANLQKLSLIMGDEFGASSLAHAAKFNIADDPSQIIILDGIRRDAELKLVQKFKNNLLLYITAKSNLRYKRLKLRSEKVGETHITYPQFLAEEKSKAETEIPNLGKKADLKIINNDTLEAFGKRINQLAKKLLY